VYYVIGEVKNNGDTPANVNVTAIFYNSQGIPLATRTENTSIKYVGVGQKTPFKIALADSNAPRVATYNILSIGFKEIQASKPLDLEILNSTFYAADEKIQITGTVRNKGTLSATGTIISVTYYNKTTGNILWISRGVAIYSNITYGQKSYFEISSNPKKISPEQVNITLIAESQEYLSPICSNPIQDTITPQIGAPVLFPTEPTPQEIVGINITVTKPDYASNVTMVLLHFKGGGGQWKTKNMTKYGDLWRSFIDVFGAGQTVLFRFEAFDKAGKSSQTTYYSYTVKGEPQSGVPLEALLIVFIVLILIVVIVKYRRKLF